MAYPKIFLLMAIALAVLRSVAIGKEASALFKDEIVYTKSDYGQRLAIGRFEPTRPSQARNDQIQQDRRGRFAPTRPLANVENYLVRDQPIRYEPTRPEQAETRRGKRRIGNDYLETAIREDERVDAIYSRYDKAIKLEGKGAKIRKLLFKPVKVAFKVSSKTVKKGVMKLLIPVL